MPGWVETVPGDGLDQDRGQEQGPAMTPHASVIRGPIGERSPGQRLALRVDVPLGLSCLHRHAPSLVQVVVACRVLVAW
jgi:hypothetical protein